MQFKIEFNFRFYAIASNYLYERKVIENHLHKTNRANITWSLD
jgi:hypothetical protein